MENHISHTRLVTQFLPHTLWIIHNHWSTLHWLCSKWGGQLVLPRSIIFKATRNSSTTQSWTSDTRHCILMAQYFYQEDPKRAACAPSQVSITSDDTFDSGNILRGSKSLVPSDIPPEHQSLSPHPSHFLLELGNGMGYPQVFHGYS